MHKGHTTCRGAIHATRYELRIQRQRHTMVTSASELRVIGVSCASTVTTAASRCSAVKSVLSMELLREDSRESMWNESQKKFAYEEVLYRRGEVE